MHLLQHSLTNAAHMLSTPKLQSSSSSMPPWPPTPSLFPQVQISIVDPLNSFNRVDLVEKSRQLVDKDSIL
ncbi:hypothetical protein ABKN59_010411 [Abortiporus biennis]